MPALSGDTRLSQVLEAIPGALDYIVALNPHDFERLRNPVLRRYMSPRISLRRVAAIVHLPEERLVEDLNRLAAGEPVHNPQPRPSGPVAGGAAPPWLEQVDLETIPWVDVVPIDAVGGDPFPLISLAVRQLESGGVLGIRHRWQPQPLYDIWGKMDLEWFPQRIGPDEWYIFVHRPASVPAFPTKPVIGAEIGKIPRAEVLPRLQVLAEQLAPGQVLEATGLAGQPLTEVCAALEPRLGPSYLVEAAPPSANRPTLRVTHRSG